MFPAKRRAVVLLCLLGMLSYAPRTTTAESHAAEGKFAFWYGAWQPDLTLGKLAPANVIIGAPPSAVPEIHESRRRVLQYVTYYQSVFHQPFLKDRSDLPNVGFQLRGEFQKSAFGGEDNYVLCPNSAELKSRVLNFVDVSLKQGFDGYFVDNTFPDPAAHEICTAQHNHVRAGVDGWQAYADLLASVKSKIKHERPNALLIVNPGNPAWLDQMASQSPSLWDVFDYVLWESYGYSSHRGAGHDRWKTTIEESFSYATVPEKARKLVVLSYPEDLTQARFAFAVAKIFGFNWTSNLGDRDQNTNREGGHFGAFLNEIPFDLGEPLGSLPVKTTPLLHRSFQGGEAFANTGTTAESVIIAKGGTVYVGDQQPHRATSVKLVIPPMTSAIILTRMKLNR